LPALQTYGLLIRAGKTSVTLNVKHKFFELVEENIVYQAVMSQEKINHKASRDVSKKYNRKPA
jgi:hypothetical protein